MPSRRNLAVGLSSLLLLAGVALAIDRGGLLAWLGVVLGGALLFKAVKRSGATDPVLAASVLAAWGLSWGIAWFYVQSTWESGEVVQIEVDGGRPARVWVMDTEAGPIMYYDAPPEAAQGLLAGAPMTMVRNRALQEGCARATRLEDLPAERVQDLFGRMEQKYGEQSSATNVFYLVLGVKRDRVGLVIELAACG